ncbi:unnamed protein product [Adineta steineri]|uniref:F-box domain-containing protein n=1 Tax=Adineta steineri TaxID=433720 RepID=A0A819X734_9BILA|nr:unnamed protein product [Adineta steineri]CAF4134839.1 unnamed protein product [Adineta steineri]
MRTLTNTRQLQGADRQLTYMILGQILLIIITILPDATFRVYLSASFSVNKTTKQADVEYFNFNVLNYLSNITYGSGFYVFLIVSKTFRPQVKHYFSYFGNNPNAVMPANKISSKMKFEQLPNEMLIECFQYLNAPDIFYSFNRLNYQFYILIRDIHLHFNFEQVKKSSFNEFCQTIRINPKIKQNIIYLKLSNIDLREQIESFFSLFALNNFINLRSLSVIDIRHDDTKQNYHTEREQEQEQVSSMLTLLPNLY